MTTLPADLPKRLRAAGLQVTEIDGWRTRRTASSSSFAPVGVLNHHDARPDIIGDFADDLDWAKWMFLTGRSDLGPPLCQLSLSREGRVFIGAAGRANHAGVAKPSGSVAGGDGNTLYVGIEWMLGGFQPIPKSMYQAAVKLNGVLTEMLGNSVRVISCHYQTSVTGKWDIGDPHGIPFNGHQVLDVDRFRKAVAEWRADQNVPPEPEFWKLPLVTFNPWVGNKDLRGNLRDVLTATDFPVGLALQEMKGEHLELKGYTRVEANPQRFPHRDHRSNVLFVRDRGVEILHTGVLDMADYGSKGWTWGPKGEPKTSVKHPPKVFPFARLGYDGQEAVVMAGHRVAGGFTINQEEWDAEHRAIREWFNDRQKVPCVALMDWNDRLNDDEPRGVGRLAAQVDGWMELRGIDGALHTNTDGASSKKLERKFGSDAHRPVSVTVKKEI